MKSLELNEQEGQFESTDDVPDVFGDYVKVIGHWHPLSVPSRYVRNPQYLSGSLRRGNPVSS